MGQDEWLGSLHSLAMGAWVVGELVLGWMEVKALPLGAVHDDTPVCCPVWGRWDVGVSSPTGFLFKKNLKEPEGWKPLEVTCPAVLS